MRNRFEIGPMPDNPNPEMGLNIPEAPETNQEQDGTDFERAEEEIGEKEAEVRPEVEAQFKDALSLLYLRVQRSREKAQEFPDKDKLRELIEDIPLFAKMYEGAKRMFLAALNREPEFHSADEEEFVNKGIEALDLLIHTATLKQGGDAWQQARAEERQGKARQPEAPE